jgi:2-polyprenyl-3-methyl-5-hydroxy-6-metoxy-1,4-benzoquinol methylase
MPSDRRRWSKLGAKQPYWASVADPRYRADKLDDDTVEAFFQSGEREMAATLATIRQFLGPDFHPARALDFGCGIGRLTIPLARESRHVVAVDISDTMLREAAENCEEQEISNVEFLDTRAFSDDSRRRRFDFVHSFSVFQHIKPRLGFRTSRRILDMLTIGGVGALHYTYARKAGIVRKGIHRVRRWVPPVNLAANLLQRRSLLEPAVPMYQYSLSRLFELFHEKNCSILNIQFTEQGGYSGATFFVQKAAQQP